MTAYSIQAEGLGKRYRIVRGKRRQQFREQLTSAISTGLDSIRLGFGFDADDNGRSANRKFWALRDISFRIAPGESVGIIGSNGAGKSTLLKILSRITAPTAGRVRLRGRVGSLLEVGTGFHSELTGRENIFLNGAVLGMRRREIESKFNEIVDFSGVEEFLETPVKFYSSGMRMRLAFSVAAHLEPEILLVDEVLAVGDAAFQQKCLSKMGDVVGHGRTVLFVSHNMAAVRALCQSAMFIDRGHIVYSGDVNSAIERYLDRNTTAQNAPMEFEPKDDKAAQILSVAVEDEAGKVLTSTPHDRDFWVAVKVAARRPVYKGFLEVNLLDGDLDTIVTARDLDQGEASVLSQDPGTYSFRVRFKAPGLVPGKYSLRVRTLQRMKTRNWVLDDVNAVWPFEIYDNGSMLSRFSMSWSGKFILPAEWKWVREEDLRREQA